ncbi:hypothetical protein [Flavobacterium sp.]|uniref:hypothetical protein n=1 Tax=Flavobacterium sp. TaxID=239 RepID=UPI00286D7063|nr:hypothetical protein [Flavobacterium sp.]
MQHTKTTTVYLFLILTFYINCKNIDNKDIKNEIVKNDTTTLELKDPESLVSNTEEIKNESTTFFFNKIFNKQMFPLDVEKTDVEKEFRTKKIEINKNILYFLDCSTEIRIKNDKTKNYLNGQQNIEIYDDILSEFNFKLTEDVKYIIPLYPDNKCNLPSERFILLDKNNLLFIYKGYLVLFTKSLNSNPEDVELSKIICDDEKGNMEDGFITNCVINENLKIAYDIFIKESEINEIKYLKKDIPLKDLNYTMNDEVEVFYKNKINALSIELFFQGGETFITFANKNNKTEIIIKNFPQ